MNRDDIIRMAKEAGLEVYSILEKQQVDWDCLIDDLEEFHAIAVAAEREACAKLCESLGVHSALNIFNGGPEWYRHGKDCAAAIRARGEA
jgi:hypothetical protein